MEFLDLVTWLLLAGTAWILLPAAITVPGSGLVGFAALGGLTACILFMALGTPDWASWTQVGMAIVGILGGTLATRWLWDDEHISGAKGEVLQAGTLGLALPFFGVALFLSLLLAAHGVEPVV